MIHLSALLEAAERFERGETQDRELSLLFTAGYPGRLKLEQLGKSWKISNAERVVAQVYAAVAGWKEMFAEVGVAEEEIFRFKEIDAYLQE